MVRSTILFGTCAVCIQAGAAPEHAKRSTRRYEKERAFAVHVIREAAALCLRAPRGAVLKRDATPVTVADLAIQATITRALREVFPEDVLIGEEDTSGHEDDSLWQGASRLAGFNVFKAMHQSEFTHISPAIDTCSRCWTLDPIDGTKGFVSGNSYAVGLALLDSSDSTLGTSSSPPLGTLALPRDGIILLADTEEGRLEQFALEGKLPNQKNWDIYPKGELVWMLSGVQDLKVEDWPPWTRLCCGSLVKYAAVARGDAVAFVQVLHGKSPAVWDHAAGVASVVASGGIVSGDTGRGITFGAGPKRRDVQVSPDTLAIVATRQGEDHDRICHKVRTALVGRDSVS